MVQKLRLWAPNAGGQGLSLLREPDPRSCPWRFCWPNWKNTHTARRIRGPACCKQDSVPPSEQISILKKGIPNTHCWYARSVVMCMLLRRDLCTDIHTPSLSDASEWGASACTGSPGLARGWGPGLCWWEGMRVQPLWNGAQTVLKKLKAELPYDLAIPLLGICPKETRSSSWRHSCSSMLVIAFFKVAKVWKMEKT